MPATKKRKHRPQSAEQALLACVAENPMQSTPRRILADYYEETGRPLFAEQCRVCADSMIHVTYFRFARSGDGYGDGDGDGYGDGDGDGFGVGRVLVAHDSEAILSAILLSNHQQSISILRSELEMSDSGFGSHSNNPASERTVNP